MTAPHVTWPELPWYLRTSTLDAVVFSIGLFATLTIATVAILRQENVAGFTSIATLIVGQILSRWWRWTGLLLVVSGAVIAGLFAVEYVGPWTIVVFTAFCVTIRLGRALPVAAIAGVPVYLTVVYRDPTSGPLNAQALVALSTIVAAAACGAAVRAHERYRGEVQHRATDAIGRRTAETDTRLATERVRIAQDLHDAVGHEIAVVSMSLGVAQVNLDTNPQATRQALEAARTSVQQVLLEMQEIMLILHRGDPETASEPLASYERIAALVSQYEAGGGHVDAHIDPPPAALPSRIGVTAYRITQEALTNAQRHGAGTVRVRIDATLDAITIDVSNAKDTTAAPQPGTGHGLVGIRERTEAAGGRVSVDDSERQFAVQAILPIHPVEVPR